MIRISAATALAVGLFAGNALALSAVDEPGAGQIVERVVISTDVGDGPLFLDVNKDGAADLMIEVGNMRDFWTEESVRVEFATSVREELRIGTIAPSPVDRLDTRLGEFATIRTISNEAFKSEEDFFPGTSAFVVTDGGPSLFRIPTVAILGAGQELSDGQELLGSDSAFLYADVEEQIRIATIEETLSETVGHELDDRLRFTSGLEPDQTGFVAFGIQSEEVKGTQFGFLEITRGSVTINTIGFQPNTGPGASALTVSSVPLPAPALLLLAALGGLGLMRRRAA